MEQREFDVRHQDNRLEFENKIKGIFGSKKIGIFFH